MASKNCLQRCGCGPCSLSVVGDSICSNKDVEIKALQGMMLPTVTYLLQNDFVGYSKIFEAPNIQLFCTANSLSHLERALETCACPVSVGLPEEAEPCLGSPHPVPLNPTATLWLYPDTLTRNDLKQEEVRSRICCRQIPSSIVSVPAPWEPGNRTPAESPKIMCFTSGVYLKKLGLFPRMWKEQKKIWIFFYISEF